MFENQKDSLFNHKTILKSQQRIKNDHHDSYKDKVHKSSLSSNDNKKLQTFDKLTTYPYEINTFKVSENEMLSKCFATYK